MHVRQLSMAIAAYAAPLADQRDRRHAGGPHHHGGHRHLVVPFGGWGVSPRPRVVARWQFSASKPSGQSDGSSSSSGNGKRAVTSVPGQSGRGSGSLSLPLIGPDQLHLRQHVPFHRGLERNLRRPLQVR